jgi:hypothetical protein
MNEEQTAEALGFIEATATYLEDMAERGDHAALYLYLKAVGILEAHGAGAEDTDDMPIRAI